MDSLYKSILNLQQPPQLLAVSPATLLSLVRAVIDALIDNQIPATLWLKLPPGEIWQAEVQRYHNQVQLPHTTYIIVPQDNSNLDKYKFPSVPIRLKFNNQLRREYFLMVTSPNFCSLIFAYRLGPKQRQIKAKENTTLSKGAAPSASMTIRKRPPLVALYSFEGHIIQSIINSLKLASGDEPQIMVEVVPAIPEPLFLNQILTKQIHHQEQIRSRAKFRRNQALNKVIRARKQSNLSVRDDFLSELCQEFRTPLAHMKMALSLLNSPQLKPAQKQRYLQVLSTECDRQNSLINGLLELIQLDRAVQTPLESVRLSEIVPGVVSTYQPLATEKGIMLAYTIPEDLPPVSCVNAWLKQIVINLLHNSIKFTPTNGQVWVRSRLQNDFVQLEFRDTGIGIPPSEIPKIFDRFYRVRPAAGEDVSGAGLGLTIVQQLLLRCGGSISVKSRLGEGSTFNVLFPVYPSEELKT
ncbi:DICT sensory domain-containing protein [Gloeocapsopsis dulcis]|uniref:histidine kinase n=1 Tax=Gloeocapsopsis dulcis AAB1 = 1H9 TaxID=1433147 RepID=A0A6N8FZ32_9CHRO|nr:DICT sensory domain-containing protein [Gloeocapsopsis dulcis]MUL37387.1 ATPase [Gloeocapsopsis dulcis AAB1 = 1H9]WNN88898.1 DICT sensory domain-containing protein [Gloeocapsopsis dulcis]